MRINADFSRRASVVPDQYQWVTSPQGGVERVMLDRLGEEKARATSIVRYAPGSFFPRHEHPGGEEILVLSGTFSDASGDYPSGWYLRNPPGSSHEPFSREGATLFVKLWQMPPEEGRCVRIDTRDPAAWRRQEGREVCALFASDGERVRLLRLGPGDNLFSVPVESAELLVLSGDLTEDSESYPRGSWMRLPAGEYPAIAAGAQGATLYLKTGHLAGMAVEA
ncbi:cupin domain-containing protein [Billgrantia lactosivorans]|uniref:cupin domain-containing protein n=1 Tax=Billgrantia lactosivorans TaxID=2185141 RepID=UPI000DABBF36|nr:cupin domain-containing protein [Halomonas lactosivorans]